MFNLPKRWRVSGSYAWLQCTCDDDEKDHCMCAKWQDAEYVGFHEAESETEAIQLACNQLTEERGMQGDEWEWDEMENFDDNPTIIFWEHVSMTTLMRRRGERTLFDLEGVTP